MEERIGELGRQVLAETGKIIIGKERQVKLTLVALLSQGHILLDDLPGAGKTTLVKTLSIVLGLDSRRIQFVPDLLPADILGMNIYNQKTGEFQLMRGPIMTNLLLADEINRAIPRTQSALLEAMEEEQVTIDGETYPLPQPFVVMATQNPVESETTFQLPAAQMDRFLVRLSLGYPNPEEEARMLDTLGDGIPFAQVDTVTSGEELLALQKEVQSVYVSPEVSRYIVEIAAATRSDPMARMGVSPRGSRSLYRASKAWAALEGRSFVTPDDVQLLVHPVLDHRVLLSNEARLSGMTAEKLLDRTLEKVPVPPASEELLHG